MSKPRRKLRPKMRGLSNGEMNALEWAIDQAYADQSQYWSSGAFHADYPQAEQAFAAAVKADYCRRIAAFCNRAGLSQGESWAEFAKDWDEIATGKVVHG